MRLNSKEKLFIKPPLLLTSCITACAPLTKLTDSNKRLDLTIKSIREWIRIQSDIKIIICDGSNFDFSSIANELFPTANIECLFFQNSNHLVKQYGKGYGEGEIIDYALRHSLFLNQADFFTKCTSKLWVKNYINCLNSWNGSFKIDCNYQNIKSLNNIKIGYFDTRFYLTSKLFYKKYLSTAHLNVNDLKDQPLERCFKEIIESNNIDKYMFPILPIIKGVSGSTEINYKHTIKQIIEDKIRRKALNLLKPNIFS
jgi:hypothetical protein